MAATGTPTTNIGLRRPQGTDPASVDDINYNSEVIDTKMGAVGNTSLQAQVNALSSQIAGYGSSKIYTVGANQSITIPMTGFGVWLIFRSYAPNIVFVKANGDVESAVGNATHISVSVSNNILTVTNLLTWANMIIAMGA